MASPQAFARALRAAAIVVAVVATARALAGGTEPLESGPSLAVVRLVAAGVAVVVAFLSSPERDISTIRRLAFLLGMDAWVVALGVMIVTPAAMWEEGAIIVAVLLGAALFIPWSWRWQASLAAFIVVGTSGVVLWLASSGDPPARGAERFVLTLAALGAASAVGAHLAERERQRVATYQAEQRALEQERLRERRLESLTRLAGGFAHQFNNLLGGILTHAAVLREDATQGGARAELDQILAAARRGGDLTKELLRFARDAPMAVRPTPATAIVHSVAELARTTLPETVVVDLQVPTDLPVLAADPDHLVHACLELVLNARDAMRGHERGRLTLAAAEENVRPGETTWPEAAPGRYVRLSVTDTGAGMDAATLDRLFEPFFTTKPMHQAAGLGLAQVHRIVRDHGGTVRIESAPRRGTTVHLLIPVSPEQPEVRPAAATVPAAPAAAEPAPAAGAGGTILIVDDEEIVRTSLRRALTRFGYRVLEAGDAGTALVALQSADPPVDLVILDLVLPGGGAGVFELLKAVRPDLRVLVSSGYSPDADTARALEGRADGFLPKPYEITELRRAVARALGRAAA